MLSRLRISQLGHSFWWCCNQRREHRDTDAPHDAEDVCGSDLEGGKRDPVEGATLSQRIQPPCGCEDHATHTLQVHTQVVGRMLPSRCRWRFSLTRHGASEHKKWKCQGRITS